MPRKALSIMAVFVTILLGFAALAGRRASVHTIVPSPRPAQEHQQSGSRAFQIVTLSARNDMVSGTEIRYTTVPPNLLEPTYR
jgi:hypothetical protein